LRNNIQSVEQVTFSTLESSGESTSCSRVANLLEGLDICGKKLDYVWVRNRAIAANIIE